MIMTSSAVLTSSSSGGGGGYKLDSAGKVDLGKSQGAAGGDTFIGLRREPGSEYVISVPSNVLGNIHNSSGGSPQLHQGKAKLVPATVGLVVGSGQEENWGGFGTQQAQQKTYTLGKPMGGESSPVKNKTLLGQSQTKTNNMGKADPPAVLNPVRPQPPREDAVGGGEVRGGVTAAAVVGQASEHSQEGKRGNLRKGPGHSQTQSNCIRQILLLQLELIEQQQQQLQAKSKEIDDLKVEKEMLVARIERMERRLQLGKKEGGGEQQQRGGSRREDQGPGTPEGQGSAEGRGATTPRTLHFGRGGKGHKRRFLFQDPRSVKSRRNQSKVSPQKEGLVFSKEEPGSGSDVEDASPDASCAHTEELDYLSTTDMYLCCWHLPPPSPPPSPWREPSPKKNDCVAIPSWRENNMDPLGKEETTDVPENLDDNVFLKRHSKHELDEKRRKRWDIQRIREQRMFQRLQQRMNRRKGIQETEPEVLSFYPEPEDVESLIITPHLPVVAFGRPLPKLTRRSFDLPWLDDRSRCRVEMPKKQTPHRTCRK